jgi:GNAT superfamily N-acetyltransferase
MGQGAASMTTLSRTPFELRPARPDEIEFAFAVKHDAMGPHITAKWGWDEDVQRKFHATRWTQKPWSIICCDDEEVGTVSLHWQPAHLQFGEFYILAAQRRRGLGSQVLEHAVREADARGVETRLEFLKWNPVGSLYLRHGFRGVSEDEIHFVAVRPCPLQIPGSARAVMQLEIAFEHTDVHERTIGRVGP